MIASRLQILAERYYFASVFPQVVEGFQYFAFCFAEPEHNAAFGHDASFRDVPYRGQADLITRLVAYERSKSFDSFDVMTYYIGI